MTSRSPKKSTQASGDGAPAAPTYVLRLYVTGATARSRRAILNISTICKEQLEGRYDLEVIDIHQRPALAKDEQVLAAPTLIKSLPLPLRRIIGDLSDHEKVLYGLDIQPKNTGRKAPS
ncbi:MAG: circadian clock KaiB family protein [Candidatus Velthaea sp.]